MPVTEKGSIYSKLPKFLRADVIRMALFNHVEGYMSAKGENCVREAIKDFLTKNNMDENDIGRETAAQMYYRLLEDKRSMTISFEKKKR